MARWPSYPIDRDAVLREAHRRNIPALGDPERLTVECPNGHAWDRRDENAPVDGAPCKRCLAEGLIAREVFEAWLVGSVRPENRTQTPCELCGTVETFFDSAADIRHHEACSGCGLWCEFATDDDESGRRRLGIGGWPLVPSATFPGETTLSCPKCGSTAVTLTGSPGTELRPYTIISCGGCKFSQYVSHDPEPF